MGGVGKGSLFASRRGFELQPFLSREVGFGWTGFKKVLSAGPEEASSFDALRPWDPSSFHSASKLVQLSRIGFGLKDGGPPGRVITGIIFAESILFHPFAVVHWSVLPTFATSSQRQRSQPFLPETVPQATQTHGSLIEGCRCAEIIAAFGS